MTLNNNKRRISPMFIAALLFGLLAIQPITSFPNSYAQQQSEQTIGELLRKVPPLSDLDKINAEKIAMSHPEVKKIMNERKHEVMSVATVGNLYTDPITAYQDVHINVANQTQIEVVVDSENNEVLLVSEHPLLKVPPPASGSPAFAIDYIVSSQTVNGLQMTFTAPSYGTTGADKYSAFLVNAIEPGYTSGFACSASHVADSYFAQAGVNYQFSTAATGYADTGAACIFQPVSWVPYVGTRQYIPKIYTSAPNGPWNLGVTDLNTGNYFVFSRGGQNYNYFKTSDTATSVFFENWNKQSAWTNQFTPKTISATAKYSTNNGSTWNNWTGETKIVYNCSGTPITNNVITGSLVSGGTASWNLLNMPLGC